MNVIEIEGLSLHRSGREILSNVSWHTQNGEHWVIMGPNGAGKTTLVRALTGREHPQAGIIRISGTELTEHDPQELGARIGFSSSSVVSRLRHGMTALDVVRTAAWGQAATFGEEYEDIDNERAHDVLAAFGIAHIAGQRFSTLSEGERQRVLLARALMADPEILILDEPTAGLDLGARETLMEALREIIAAPTAPQIILITHQMEEIPVGITHALLMKDGTVAAAGSVTNVLTDIEVSQVFGIPLKVTHSNGRWNAQAVRR